MPGSERPAFNVSERWRIRARLPDGATWDLSHSRFFPINQRERAASSPNCYYGEQSQNYRGAAEPLKNLVRKLADRVVDKMWHPTAVSVDTAADQIAVIFVNPEKKGLSSSQPAVEGFYRPRMDEAKAQPCLNQAIRRTNYVIDGL